MSGIYIHVPFCKSRCHYCDFFKSTRLHFRDQYLNRLFEELRERDKFFPKDNAFIESIYLGGGTPSLISIEALHEIINTIFGNYKVNSDAEITMEVNPDDLTPGYIAGLKRVGINRLSVGIQSFLDDDLRRMGRRHDSLQSKKALSRVFTAGFENVGIDFIYGLPWAGRNELLENIDVMSAFPIKHLSAYHLTIEAGTVFGEEKKRNKLKEPDEGESEKQFWLLHDELEKMGFDHYEISNFAVEGYQSIHNSSYWKGIPYLGIGPGAHSFDGEKRYWNKADIQEYMKSGYFSGISSETLTMNERFNEKIMLGLRTKNGIMARDMETLFPELWKQTTFSIKGWIDKGYLRWENGKIFSTREGWFVIDGVIENLFIV